MTTQQLEYLLAIDRAPTWAEAAATVGVTPSALSQGIAELERRLGVALFDRDGRRRVPTRDHGPVLHYAEQTVAATHDLARWLDQRRVGSTGTVRIGMIDAAATHHCRDALRRYRSAHPEVDLHLTVGPSGGLLEGLQRAELDAVVCVRPPVTPVGIDVAPLLDDPLAVLAPASEGRRNVDRWGPWVTFPAGSHTRRIIATALSDAGASFEVVAESHQPEVLREMAMLGIGWTVLPLAGIGPVGDLRIVRRALAVRQLVVARRTGAPPDRVLDDLVSGLRDRRRQ